MSTTRTDTPEGVQYADPDTHRAAIVLHDEWGFSLPKLDAWIEERCPDGDREQMLQFRSWAIAAVLAGESRTVLPWTMFFVVTIDNDIKDMVLKPRAVRQARRQASERGNRVKGAAARRIYTDDEKAEWRTMRAAEFAAHSARRAAELIVSRLGLPASAFETVRNALKENG